MKLVCCCDLCGWCPSGSLLVTKDPVAAWLLVLPPLLLLLDLQYNLTNMGPSADLVCNCLLVGNETQRVPAALLAALGCISIILTWLSIRWNFLKPDSGAQHAHWGLRWCNRFGWLLLVCICWIDIHSWFFADTISLSAIQRQNRVWVCQEHGIAVVYYSQC